MAKGIVTKQGFIDYLKQKNPECFESGTPFLEDSCEAYYQIKMREYAKQFCSKLSNGIVLKNVYSSFLNGMNNLRKEVIDNHVDMETANGKVL